MKTLATEVKESIRKVLELCLQAVTNNDYNWDTIKAVNACRSKFNRFTKLPFNTTKFVLISEINYMLKFV